jgi:hypothetical protein
MIAEVYYSRIHGKHLLRRDAFHNFSFYSGKRAAGVFIESSSKPYPVMRR